MATRKTLTNAQRASLLETLERRFLAHPERHAGIAWNQVEARLLDHPEGTWSLFQMEDTGGEPDVVGKEKKTGAFRWFDCAAESPAGRRSLCYDRDALDARAEHPPKNAATEVARALGITLLSEDDYRYLQTLGAFDQKTSSWIETPARIRQKGGALFMDRRYDTVFVYHNGASSYYAARGFRGSLTF